MTAPPGPSDPTFTNYTRFQAQTYFQNRLSYPQQLYEKILTYHTSTGGQLDVLADIGCGPGRATRDMASAFDYAIGLDPGIEMIQAALTANQRPSTPSNMAEAQDHYGRTRTGRDVLFAVCAAENCTQGVTDLLLSARNNDSITETQDFQVDLLTAAMAAHWFSMPEFWAQAAKLVKPQGTVALWTCSSLYCHPSTRNAAAVQKALFHLEREVLSAHELPPNRVSRDMYENLVLPWQVNDSYGRSDLASVFPRQEFVRYEWDRDGVLSNGEDFFMVDYQDKRTTTLEDLESSLGTASMVTRWREAHPDLAGTEKDCVREMVAEIRGVVGDENPELRLGSAVVLLLFKKR